MFHDRYWDALITLIILFSTDWIDGYLARKLDQVTTVGKWLDPFADRLSLWVVIITVVATGLAPLWLIFALMIPDLVLAGLMVLIYTRSEEHTSELQSRFDLVCRLLLEKENRLLYFTL